MSVFDAIVSPEFRALCALTRLALYPDTPPNAAIKALEQVKNWDDFIAGARRHRVLANVEAVLGRLHLASVPPSVLSEIQQEQQRHVLLGMAHVAELIRVLKLFAQAEIAVLSLKGIVLSQQLYQTPFQRGFGDFDLLIAPDRFAQAHRILLSAGYLRRGIAREEKEGEHILPLTKDVTYDHPHGYIVELHVTLSESYYRAEWAFPRLWEHRVGENLGGFAVNRMESSEQAVYLLSHGAAHCWNRLAWVADIALLLADPETRQKTIDLCYQRGLTRSLRHWGWLAALWLGVSVPELPPAFPARAQAWFLRAFFADRRWLEQPKRGGKAWVILQIRQRVWRMYEAASWTYFARAIRRQLWNPVDQQTLPLPRRLSFLYPILRPLIWVMRNYGGKK